jgi:hypothetical protein
MKSQPITQKQKVKSLHNTRSINTSQQLLEQKHTRTAAYKKQYELKEMGKK